MVEPTGFHFEIAAFFSLSPDDLMEELQYTLTFATILFTNIIIVVVIIKKKQHYLNLDRT